MRLSVGFGSGSNRCRPKPKARPTPLAADPLRGPLNSSVRLLMPWYAPKDPTPREQCPCCGDVTLPERGMSLIGPVCSWEDDAFVGNRLDERSPCNKMTLREARSNFAAFGACDRNMLVHVVAVAERSRFAWEPLSEGMADA